MGVLLTGVLVLSACGGDEGGGADGDGGATGDDGGATGDDGGGGEESEESERKSAAEKRPHLGSRDNFWGG